MRNLLCPLAFFLCCCWRESCAAGVLNDLGILGEPEQTATTSEVRSAVEARMLQPSQRVIGTEAPSLSGYHLRITAIEQPDYFEIQQDWDGSYLYSGYLVDILTALAREDRGNFTYELLTPSGYGEGCTPQLSRGISSINNTEAFATTEPLSNKSVYDISYRTQFTCGEGDINDMSLWDNGTGVVTDLLWGSYYITPERLLKQKFTVPFSPPTRVTLGMMGAVTHVRDLQDVADNHASDYAMCAFAGTAYMVALETSFPQLNFRGITYTEDLHDVFTTGTCDIVVADYPSLTVMVRDFSQQNRCLVNGMVRIGTP